jgi:RNA polymerase sigma-70 factor, ECF subfamily
MSSIERDAEPDRRQVGSTQVLLTDLFRRESGRLIAVLTARTGPQHLDRVQDAVQDAMVAALRTWPWRGVPANPSGWLYIAARNVLFDRLRRARCEAPDELLQAAAAPCAGGDAELEDDLLRLIVYCCHPLLSQNAQLALTLRLACGLSVEEIAGALLTAPAAIAQRIARAKRELREQRVAFALPDAAELAETRLPSALQALYLLFNAGYLSVHHEQWLRPALCSDALRLSIWLASHPATARPQAHALAALLSFSAARLTARQDVLGAPVRLLAQDRSQWDAALIARAFRHFDASITGEGVSRYHIEAAIAATHAQARDLETTDWCAILTYYDQLCAHYPSAIATLNRIIALRYVHGPRAALDAFTAAAELLSLQDSLLYHATLGDLHQALGDWARASEAFQIAAALTQSDALARSLLERGTVQLTR